MKGLSWRLGFRTPLTAGFTLVEALVSIVLMGAIVASLSAVTGQWLPNWHRGFGRVQRIETFDVGLQRLVGDLQAAEFITPNGATKTPFFFGDAKSLMFVRVSNAPGTTPHLEYLRLAETVDARGFALVRSRAPFKPLDPNRPPESQLSFADPVVLIRAPFRVSFDYAGDDRLWRASWRDSFPLPSAVRFQVRDAATDQILLVSTATLMHMDVPAACVTQKSVKQCLAGTDSQTTAQPSIAQPTAPQPQPAGNQP
jgi:general secretion pathway protein J